jgi:hypothetical protein
VNLVHLATPRGSRATLLRILHKSSKLNPTSLFPSTDSRTSSSSSFTQTPTPPTPVAQINPLLVPIFPMAGVNQPNQTNPPRVAFTINLYSPLDFANVANPLNALPVGNYGKRVPKFVGNNVITAESHVKAFLEYLENLGVTKEDVVMKLFAQSLTLDARDLYKGLATNSINGWITFHDRFMDKWSRNRAMLFSLSLFL